MRSISFRHRASAAAASAALAFACGPAVAAALFFSSAQATLEITDISAPGPDVMISATVDELPFEQTAGTATASSVPIAMVDGVDPFDLGLGDGLSLSSMSNGSAMGMGDALADTMTEGMIFIDNQSNVAVSVSFTFEFDLNADASVMDPFAEFAFAMAQFDVLSASTDVAGMPLVDLFERVESDSDLGGGPAPLTGTLNFDVTVAAGQSEIITARTGALALGASMAAVALPAPPAAWLLALGLLGLFYGRRVRRHSI